MSKNFKKICALILSTTTILSTFSVSGVAFADETTDTATTMVDEVEVVDESTPETTSLEGEVEEKSSEPSQPTAYLKVPSPSGQIIVTYDDDSKQIVTVGEDKVTLEDKDGTVSDVNISEEYYLEITGELEETINIELVPDEGYKVETYRILTDTGDGEEVVEDYTITDNLSFDYTFLNEYSSVLEVSFVTGDASSVYEETDVVANPGDVVAEEEASGEASDEVTAKDIPESVLNNISVMSEGTDSGSIASANSGISTLSVENNKYTKPFLAPYYPEQTASIYNSTTNYSKGWNNTNGKWFYMLDNRRYYANGLATVDGKNYYFDNNGYCVTGWVRYTQDVRWGYNGVRIMYFDPTNAWMVTRYQVIDGIGRSFGNSGFLQIGRGNWLTWDGVNYTLDDAAVCGVPKQSQGTSTVPAQNVFTSISEDDVLDGNYQFQAKMLDDTVVEPFGFTPIPNSAIPEGNTKYNYMCIVKDDSLKGKIGAWYRNVGTYKGRVIDAKATITDYQLYPIFGQDYGIVAVPNGDAARLGLAINHVVSAEITFEFYDHETGEKVSVQGYATISDIDVSQACEITSPYDHIYVADDCGLVYTPGNAGTPIFADNIFDSHVRTDHDTSGQVLVEYTGDHFSYRFFNDNSFWNLSGAPYYCLGGDMTNPYFSDNDIYNDTKLGEHSWQGYEATRFARVETPNPPVKTVSDSNETDVTANTLTDIDEQYTYKISEAVPLQGDPKFYYTSYQIKDVLEPCLTYVSSKVVDDSGRDVSSLFNIGVSGQTVTFTAKDPSAEGFYGYTYHYLINTKINKSYSNLNSYKQGDYYVVPNVGQLIVKSNYENATYDTNEVTTKVPIPEPNKFNISLTKVSSNSTCTSGNDNYSLAGAVYGVYSDEACRNQVGTITTDASGKGSISNLVAGKYWVKEVTPSKGYTLDPAKYPIDATKAAEGQTYSVSSKEVPIMDPGDVILKKVDSNTNGTMKDQGTMEGAEFLVKFYGVDVKDIADGTDPATLGYQPTRTWRLKTAEILPGQFGIDLALGNSIKVSGDDFYYDNNNIVNMPYGVLTFQEVKAPNGYLLNDTVFVQKISDAQGGNASAIVDHVTTVKEDSLKLKLTKTLSGTDTKISGVVFKWTRPDGTSANYTTDSNGIIELSGLEWGTHTLTEVSAPDGYSVNTTVVKFTVKSDNSIEFTKNYPATSTNGEVNVSLGSDGCLNVAYTNKPAPFSLTIHKINNKDFALSGAEFTLYSDKNCTKVVDTKVTGSNGQLTFQNLIPGTSYWMKETDAPAGYKIPVNADGSDIVWEVKANYTNGNFTFLVNNKAYGTDTSNPYWVSGTASNRVCNMEIVNEIGAKLPNTGSSMMLLLLVAGVMLMGGAIVISRKSRKTSDDKK